MLSNSVQPDQTKTVIEYSSGSTVISMSILARIYHGINDTRAYLSNKTSGAKLRLMQFFGLDMYVYETIKTDLFLIPQHRTLFGGPSQPEPGDSRGGIQNARESAINDRQIANPNQYENDDVRKRRRERMRSTVFMLLRIGNRICDGPAHK